MRNILFLDSESVITRLIDLSNIDSNTVEYHGVRHFGEPDVFYKKYDLVVMSHFSNLIQHRIVCQCSNVGVDTLFVFDGVYDWSNAVKNIKHIGIGLYLGMPIPTKYCLCLKGEQYIDYLKRRNSKVFFSSYTPERFKFVGRDMEKLDERIDVLITTANTAYFSEYEYMCLVKLLKKVIFSLREYKVAYRLFDKRLVRELCVKPCENYITESIGEVIKKCRCVISTPSTVGVEVSMHNKPLGTLVYKDSPLFHRGGWLIHLGIDVEKVISDMLSNSIEKKERMFFQCHEVCSNKSDLKEVFNLGEKYVNYNNDAGDENYKMVVEGFSERRYFLYILSTIFDFLKKIK